MIDLSDESLHDRFGDIMHEMPELYDAIRIFELELRAGDTPRAFSFSSNRVTVSHCVREIPIAANS